MLVHIASSGILTAECFVTSNVNRIRLPLQSVLSDVKIVECYKMEWQNPIAPGLFTSTMASGLGHVVNTACNGPSGSRLIPISSHPEHSEVDDWWTEARSVGSCRCQMTGGENSGEGVYLELVIDMTDVLGREGVVRGALV